MPLIDGGQPTQNLFQDRPPQQGLGRDCLASLTTIAIDVLQGGWSSGNVGHRLALLEEESRGRHEGMASSLLGLRCVLPWHSYKTAIICKKCSRGCDMA